MTQTSSHTVVILLGSNLGERQDYMKTVTTKLSEQVGFIESTSSYYETKSWGVENQPDFLNQVLVCRTTYSAIEVLKKCLSIEKELGRNRKVKWGSRTIDIDILYYDNEIIATSDLKVPHPFLHERRFTLVPLVEVMPDYVHPVFNLSNTQLLERCGDGLEVRRLNT